MRDRTFSTLFRRVLVAFAVLTVSGYATSSVAIQDPYGSPISGVRVDRVVRIGPSTRFVNVERFERVRFEFSESGRSFQWQFYTLGHPTIKLGQIAPDLGSQQDVMIYVSSSPDERG